MSSQEINITHSFSESNVYFHKSDNNHYNIKYNGMTIVEKPKESFQYSKQCQIDNKNNIIKPNNSINIKNV